MSYRPVYIITRTKRRRRGWRGTKEQREHRLLCCRLQFNRNITSKRDDEESVNGFTLYIYIYIYTYIYISGWPGSPGEPRSANRASGSVNNGNVAVFIFLFLGRRRRPGRFHHHATDDTVGPLDLPWSRRNQPGRSAAIQDEADPGWNMLGCYAFFTLYCIYIGMYVYIYTYHIYVCMYIYIRIWCRSTRRSGSGVSEC